MEVACAPGWQAERAKAIRDAGLSEDGGLLLGLQPSPPFPPTPRLPQPEVPWQVGGGFVLQKEGSHP